MQKVKLSIFFVFGMEESKDLFLFQRRNKISAMKKFFNGFAFFLDLR